MATGRWFVCAALMLFATTFSARAADLSVPNLDNKSLAIKPDDVRQSDAIAAAQTRDDDTFRINDLKSTRAALIDEQGRLSASALLAGLESKSSPPTED